MGLIHKDPPQLTPAKRLLAAVERGDLSGMESALQAGAKIDVWDDQHDTPLMIASEKGFGKLADVLIKKGANVHTHNKNGQTALHNAAFAGLKSERSLWK